MKLHVEVKGKGPAVLLLHGIISDHIQLYPLLPALKGFKAVMPDLLGCGQSPESSSPAVLQENLVLLKDLCTQYDIKAAIGFSLGGILAINLQLPTTILISSFCSNPIETGPLQKLHGHEQEIEQFFYTHERSAEKWLKTYGRQAYAVPGAKKASAKDTINYLVACEQDYTPLARRLKRVLVVHGSKDIIVDDIHALNLTRACRAAYINVLENHVSVLRSPVVHSAISAFLAQNSFEKTHE